MVNLEDKMIERPLMEEYRRNISAGQSKEEAMKTAVDTITSEFTVICEDWFAMMESEDE